MQMFPAKTISVGTAPRAFNSWLNSAGNVRICLPSFEHTFNLIVDMSFCSSCSYPLPAHFAGNLSSFGHKSLGVSGRGLGSFLPAPWVLQLSSNGWRA